MTTEIDRVSPFSSHDSLVIYGFMQLASLTDGADTFVHVCNLLVSRDCADPNGIHVGRYYIT